jgi:hypothetical protein
MHFFIRGRRHPANAGDAPVSCRCSCILPAALLCALLLCVPVMAAGDPAAGDVAIRQAHLAWSALDTETDMQAAVAYCTTLYGSDTANMSLLLAEFKAEEALVPSAATGQELDSLIADMRNTTGEFRTVTYAVMTRGQGNWDTLGLQMAAAKENNPYLLGKKDAYWSVRKATQLAAFDAWVQDGQQKLDLLNARGYDTAAAQRALDVFSSRRPDVQAALETKNEIAVDAINLQVRPLSDQFVLEVAGTQEQVPGNVQLQFYIDQGYRAVELADQVNLALVPVLIDIGEPDPVLARTKTDLASSRKVLSTGNLGAAKTPLRLVQKDLTDLAQAYRDVAHSAALPPGLSAELNTLALRLDDAAGQMGDAL